MFTNTDFIARSPLAAKLDDSLLFNYGPGEEKKPNIPRREFEVNVSAMAATICSDVSLWFSFLKSASFGRVWVCWLFALPNSTFCR